MIYLIVLIIGAVLSVWGPWWIMAAVALIVCRSMAVSSKQAFWQSALAMMSLWLGYGLYLHYNSAVNMANKMGGILTGSALGLGDSSNFALIFGVTAFLALIIGGLAGLAGYKLKEFKMNMA